MNARVDAAVDGHGRSHTPPPPVVAVAATLTCEHMDARVLAIQFWLLFVADAVLLTVARVFPSCARLLLDWIDERRFRCCCCFRCCLN